LSCSAEARVAQKSELSAAPPMSPPYLYVVMQDGSVFLPTRLGTGMAKIHEDTDAERRVHRRYGISVQIRPFGSKESQKSADVSLGGVFLPTSDPHKMGGCLPLRLVHPLTGEVIAAVCKVVHQVYDAEGVLVGLGLRFANIDRNLSERMRSLLEDITGEDQGPTPDESVVSVDIQDLEGIDTADLEGGLTVELEAAGASPGGLSAVPQNAREAAPLAPPEPSFRDCYREAMAASRAKRPRDAVTWLKFALARSPANAADLHLRVASIALRDLGDLKLAEEHVRAASQIVSGGTAVQRLTQEIKQQRRRGSNGPHFADGLGRLQDSPRALSPTAKSLSRRGLVGWLGALRAWFSRR
jgi:hypothetical protein